MLAAGFAVGFVISRMRRPPTPGTTHGDSGVSQPQPAVPVTPESGPSPLSAALSPTVAATSSAEPDTADDSAGGTSAGSATDGAPGTRPAGPDEQMLDMIRALPGLVVLVDPAANVRYASQAAEDLRLVRRQRLAFETLRECALKVLANDQPQVCEITLRRPPMRKLSVELRVQGIPLAGHHVLMLMTDLTEEHRLAAVRRDFIANVSHELKTPVGAMSLLSEAIVAARDDPDTVQHFATRMQTEAARLAQLINDVIDLSQVQGDDPLSHAEVVAVDDLVSSATDFVRGAADLKGIQLVVGGAREQEVYGDAKQLETALRNVMTNAIAYSEPGTRVAIAVRTSPHLIEIDVKDQGMGIPDSELDRIFERFYRVDEARSRVTGGTGLGLSIVRNVCRNHGGDCLVWSVENEGSTFTLQLPEYDGDDGLDDLDDELEEETL